MAHELDAIVDCVERSVSGDPWHGPSLDALLADVTPEQAFAHPVPGAHSIVELVLHVTAWTLEVGSRLRGELPALHAIGDWPEPGQCSEARWESARRDLHGAHSEIARLVRTIDPSRLAQISGTARDRALGVGVSYGTMILGLAEHVAYHGGQVAILKRALKSAGNI